VALAAGCDEVAKDGVEFDGLDLNSGRGRGVLGVKDPKLVMRQSSCGCLQSLVYVHPLIE
jgi:hypothetical protein